MAPHLLLTDLQDEVWDCKAPQLLHGTDVWAHLPILRRLPCLGRCADPRHMRGTVGPYTPRALTLTHLSLALLSVRSSPAGHQACSCSP